MVYNNCLINTNFFIRRNIFYFLFFELIYNLNFSYVISKKLLRRPTLTAERPRPKKEQSSDLMPDGGENKKNTEKKETRLGKTAMVPYTGGFILILLF